MESTTQIYLEITPEDDSALLGQAIAGGYEQRIDIDSFQFAIDVNQNTIKGIQQNAGVPNLKFDTVTVVKKFDNASLPIAGMLAGKKKFTEAKIAVDQQYVEDTKYRNEVLVLTLKSGYVAEITLRTSEGKAGATSIVEDIKLQFHNFEVVYWGYSGSYVDSPEAGSGKLGDDYRDRAETFATDRHDDDHQQS